MDLEPEQNFALNNFSRRKQHFAARMKIGIGKSIDSGMTSGDLNIFDFSHNLLCAFRFRLVLSAHARLHLLCWHVARALTRNRNDHKFYECTGVCENLMASVNKINVIRLIFNA